MTQPTAFVGVILLLLGVLGILLVPTIAMFSEGIPPDFPGGQGAFLGLLAAIAIGYLLAGYGVIHARPWGRLLGIAMFLVLGVALASVPTWAIALGGALILAFRWRPT